MTKETEEPRKALARRPAEGRYAVGYRKPPEHSRFKPGKSGNPRGRPPGSKNRPRLPGLHEERMKSIILEEAYRMISVNDTKGPVSIPMAQAVVRSLAVNAAKGNQRAQRLFTQLLSATETANKKLHDEYLDTAIQYKVGWENEIERCRRLGLPEPDPLPHPDHVVINFDTGLVEIRGPMSKEQKAKWDMFRDRKAECDREINELQQLVLEEPNEKLRRIYLNDIAHERKIREIICRYVPD